MTLGLSNFINDGMVGERGEITKKFTELNEKLSKRHINTYFWTIPFIVLNVLGIILILYLNSIHRIQCHSGNVCTNLNQTIPNQENGWSLPWRCPGHLDIPSDCCIAFCYR